MALGPMSTPRRSAPRSIGTLISVISIVFFVFFLHAAGLLARHCAGQVAPLGRRLQYNPCRAVCAVQIGCERWSPVGSHVSHETLVESQYPSGLCALSVRCIIRSG